MASEPSVIFQSAKLGDLPYILKEFDRAEALLKEGRPVGRVYGVSGGALVALAFGLALAAKKDPQKWGKAANAIHDFRKFLSKARGWQIRTFNINIWYGRSNLNPLRRWLEKRLTEYSGAAEATPLQATPPNDAPLSDTRALPFWHRTAPTHDPKEIMVSDLGLPLYICTIDKEAIFTMFGPPDESLQCPYQFMHMGPPQDAPLVAVHSGRRRHRGRPGGQGSAAHIAHQAARCYPHLEAELHLHGFHHALPARAQPCHDG